MTQAFLQDGNPHERWAAWCERVLQICLSDDSILSAKQFFFKWEFYRYACLASLILYSLATRCSQFVGDERPHLEVSRVLWLISSDSAAVR